MSFNSRLETERHYHYWDTHIFKFKIMETLLTAMTSSQSFSLTVILLTRTNFTMRNLCSRQLCIKTLSKFFNKLRVQISLIEFFNCSAQFSTSQKKFLTLNHLFNKCLPILLKLLLLKGACSTKRKNLKKPRTNSKRL